MKCKICKKRNIVCRAFFSIWNLTQGGSILKVDYYLFCTDCGRNIVLNYKSSDLNKSPLVIVLEKFGLPDMQKDWFYVNSGPKISYVGNSFNLDKLFNSKYPNVGFNK